ncbi:hypothetical protein CSCA_1032 [Clostridium scatologenes]|uniref:Uncharacterized protein n=1 Tax=Clostridium scatologenes TaxID=1548 RepID=A0A0E3M6X9_CLOSL|nr:hypothetical protein CSCA_1032 [Clostridium scatologenes]
MLYTVNNFKNKNAKEADKVYKITCITINFTFCLFSIPKSLHLKIFLINKLL